MNKAKIYNCKNILNEETKICIKNIINSSERGNFNGIFDESIDYSIAREFSNLREGILQWYPFNENSNILEVGAGCGAITGLLSERAKNVTAVEIDKEKCDLLRERYKKKDNLNIINNDIFNIDIVEKFDYIVIIDVISNINSNVNSINNEIELLKKCKKLLKEDGIILLATENRLGLKYFAGAPSVKTGKLFESLNNYDQYDYIKSFSKSELKDFILEAGFNNYRFFYPFPNFEFPRSIYTDDILDEMPFGHHYNDIGYDRFRFFDEIKMYKQLQKEGIVTNFSNSFLVEIYKGKIPKTKVLYAKNQYFIEKKEKICTVILEEDGVKKVCKYPLNKDAESKVLNMYKDSKKICNDRYKAFDYVPYELTGNYITMPYVDGQPLTTELSYFLDKITIDKGNSEYYKNRIIDIFKRLMQSMIKYSKIKEPDEIYTREFEKNYGTEKFYEPLMCISPIPVDIHVDHIYFDGNRYKYIDTDPVVYFNVPTEYLIWCTIESWYYMSVLNNKNVDSVIYKSEICEKIGICKNKIVVFEKWRNNTFNNKAAYSHISKYYSRVYKLDETDSRNFYKYGSEINSSGRFSNINVKEIEDEK